MDNSITYTQVVDEKSGEIKYVPSVRPPQEAKAQPGGDNKTEARRPGVRIDPDSRVTRDLAPLADLPPNTELTKVLTELLANSRRLRYNHRLEAGKLDGHRLTAYRTSSRLFKQKAIKDKSYQFTFLLDTSGSMMHGDEHSRLSVACSALLQVVHALEDPQVNIPSSIISMNNVTRLLKGFDEPLNDQNFLTDVGDCMNEVIEINGGDENACGGTSESVAYRETLAYLQRHSAPKTTNVVIVISDGEPGGSGEGTAFVQMDEPEMREVEYDEAEDSVPRLSSFWQRQPAILSFGLGIQSDARQVPTHKRVDDIEKLPLVMSDLLKGLML